MRQFLLSYYSGTLIALGGLVAVACLSCSWYINHLQADMARAIGQDAVGMEAAVDLQVKLRHLRVHTLVFVGDRTNARREVVQTDLARVDAAIEEIHRTATTPEGILQADEIEQDYVRYRENLGLERLPPPSGPMSELARWSDAHHMGEILASCRQLARRRHDRMKDSLERSEVNTVWTGRVLFGLGFTGIFAGLLSGYAAARTLTRRVTRLSVRVQAVQAHLDQDVGALTVQGPPHFGELDEQLDRVVERVSAVCKRLQEQERSLLRAEQLAAVGQLAAGVAHEIRNPLTGVKLLLQAAVRAQNPIPLTIDRTHLLLQEVARIERTVQGLMDFAQTPPLDRQLQNLRGLIDEAVAVAQSRAEMKAVTIKQDSPPKPIPAVLDRDQFLSLLTNLLFNAIDATPSGGDIGVSETVDPDGKIRVEVTDSGPGIDETIASRLFTPFTTTKPTGTGLGLTVARRVAREHGGTLTAANKPGGGACFSLTLPGSEDLHAETPGR
jgi:signal transduction histidine kinase